MKALYTDISILFSFFCIDSSGKFLADNLYKNTPKI